MTTSDKFQNNMENMENEYLCVSCGAWKDASGFEVGESSCNDCQERGDTTVRYTVDDKGRRKLLDGQEPLWYHYAHGTFRRLAETIYHQPRQRSLSDYWNRPSADEVIEAMVEMGFDRDLSEEAVKYLWREEMRKCRERGARV